MRPISIVGAILVLGLLVETALPAPPKAKPVPKMDPNTNTEKMVKAGHVTGKIVTVVESKKSFRLQVTIVVPQLNTGALNSVAQAQQSLQRAMASGNPGSMASAQQQLAQAQASLITYTKSNKDYELNTTEDVKIRIPKPPETFDDKGKVKKYTLKELRELKGDRKLPGFPGEFSNLREGQIVTVTLVRKKGVPVRPVTRPRGKKDLDVDLLNDNLPQVSMVVVVVDPK